MRKFGSATKVNDNRNYSKGTHNVELRRNAKLALKFPVVRFDEPQREAIADGFEQACSDADYRCFDCAIGHDHAHFAIAFHDREIGVIAGHLKAASTRSLTAAGVHPLMGFTGKRGGVPTPWSEGCWKVYLDSSESLDCAIRYIDRHPQKEDLSRQRWLFVRERD